MYSYCISAVFMFSAMSRIVWPHLVPDRKTPDALTGSPVIPELNAFNLAAQITFQLLGFSYIVKLSFQRAKIAEVFNLLNDLWLW